MFIKYGMVDVIVLKKDTSDPPRRVMDLAPCKDQREPLANLPPHPWNGSYYYSTNVMISEES
ncbi:hypothetical protein NC652_007745 [Populus alba x Populus x berolinensis]|nr:hypothetical protein NC652_005178 [Populus alba x Populus x berolinensis]KAJ6956776.1 hypothetical protein NC652_007745 [Populus alba x Populus x berolinensis]